MKNSQRTTRLLAVLGLTLALGACAGMNSRERGTAIGAGAGAVGGAIITGGSTVGTVGGAIIGGAIGNQTSK